MEYFKRVRSGLRSFNPANLLLEESDSDDNTNKDTTQSVIDNSQRPQISASPSEIFESDRTFLRYSPKNNYPASDHPPNPKSNNPVNLNASPTSISESENSSLSSNVLKIPIPLTENRKDLNYTEKLESNSTETFQIYDDLIESFNKLRDNHVIKQLCLSVRTKNENSTDIPINLQVPDISSDTSKFQTIVKINSFLLKFSEFIITHTNLLKCIEDEGLKEQIDENQNIEKLLNELIFQRDQLRTHYDNLADFSEHVHSEIFQFFREEIIQLRSTSQYYKENYEALLSDYKGLLHTQQTATNDDQLVSALRNRTDLLDQVKLWQENHASITHRFEMLTEDKKKCDQDKMIYELALKRLEQAENETKQLPILYESIYQSEKTIEELKRQNEIINNDLNNNKLAIQHFDNALDEMEKSKESILLKYQTEKKNYEDSISTVHDELHQTQQKLYDYEKKSNEMEEFKQQNYDLNLNVEKLQKENDNLCESIRKLNQLVQNLKDEKRNSIDRQLVQNSISEYIKEKGNNIKREQAFSVLCEVLDLPNEQRTALGVITPTQSTERKTLSRLFVEFLDNETHT